jgi:hypothetical protein
MDVAIEGAVRYELGCDAAGLVNGEAGQWSEEAVIQIVMVRILVG